MKNEAAETVALDALGWILGKDDLVGVFLGSTGLTEGDLRARAGDPEVLAAVLDFLLMDDRWITGFCDSRGLGYDAPMRARAVLPGGEQVNWT